MISRSAIDMVTVRAHTPEALMAQATLQAQRSAKAGDRVLVVYGPLGANIYSESVTQPRATREPRR